MHQFSKQPSSFSPSNSHSPLFKSRPFSPETAHRSSSAEDLDRKEAFQLQLKAESGKITPVQQERLTYLQGKITNNLFKKQSRIQKYYSDYEIHFADSPTPAPVQPKLSVGQPNDKYEREADRVASVVVDRINSPATSNPSLQKENKEDEEVKTKVDRQPKLIYTGNKLNRSVQPLPYFEKPHPSPINFPSTANRAINLAIQRLEEQKDEDIQTKLEISALQKQEQDLEEQKEEDATLQGKSILQRAEVTEDIESSINNARGSGQSLDANLQKTMGQAMGADFSGVKVHTDSTADQLNKSVQARAFTTGQDVFFKQGEYNPGSKDGQELIAHELTHVVQQKENKIRLSPSDSSETESPKTTVESIEQLLEKVQELKQNQETAWNGANYSDKWQCDNISQEVCDNVSECIKVTTKQGHVLVKGGVIPGGSEPGNTEPNTHWYFEYHMYVNHSSLGDYDPTFEREIGEGDILIGEKQEYEREDDGIEYYQFGDNLFGTPGSNEKMNLFTSLENLKNAVNNTETYVGKFWKDDSSDSD